MFGVLGSAEAEAEGRVWGHRAEGHRLWRLHFWSGLLHRSCRLTAQPAPLRAERSRAEQKEKPGRAPNLRPALSLQATPLHRSALGTRMIPCRPSAFRLSPSLLQVTAASAPCAGWCFDNASVVSATAPERRCWLLQHNISKICNTRVWCLQNVLPMLWGGHRAICVRAECLSGRNACGCSQPSCPMWPSRSV